jgi:hypothetical protein
MNRLSRLRLPRDPLIGILITAALVETAWTVFIAIRLPRHYITNHWDLAWVGLDVAQVLMVLLSAWAAWRRRALLIIFATSAATLLMLDAWFDVTTARGGDIDESLVLALVFELPFAIGLLWVTRRTVKQLERSMLSDPELLHVAFHKIAFLPRSPRDEPEQPQL